MALKNIRDRQQLIIFTNNNNALDYKVEFSIFGGFFLADNNCYARTLFLLAKHFCSF